MNATTINEAPQGLNYQDEYPTIFAAVQSTLARLDLGVLSKLIEWYGQDPVGFGAAASEVVDQAVARLVEVRDAELAEPAEVSA